MKGATAIGAVGLSSLLLRDFSPSVSAATPSTGNVEWSNIIDPPFILVTPNGPTDGGNYGPNTPGTSTAGVQEAINAAAELSVVYVYPGLPQSSNPITISKNVTLMSGYPGGGLETDIGAPPAPCLGPVTISATTEPLYAVRIKGFVLPSLAFSAMSTYYINHTTIKDCYIVDGVSFSSASDVVIDSTVFNNVWFTNYTPEGVAAPANGIATITVTSSGDNNVNQTFFNNCSIDVPYAASGNVYMFLINGANFYPVFSGCQFNIETTLTSGMATLFKLRGSGVILDASIPSQYTEFHSPVQIVEALAADCVGPQIYIDWNCHIDGGGTYALNNLVNITGSPSEYGYVKIRGFSSFGYPANPGTWPIGAGSLIVDMHFPHPATNGWNMRTPALPTGTGATHAVKNTTTQRVRIYQTGGTGQQIVDLSGNVFALPAAPPVFELGPLEKVYYTTAVPTSWRGYGVA